MDFTSTLTPDNIKAAAFFQIGVERYEAKKFAEAIDAFNSAIEVRPSIAAFYYGRGNAYEDAGFDIKAETDYLTTIELEPTNASNWFRLGFIYSKRKDYSKAIACLEQALKRVALSNKSILTGVGRSNWLIISKQVILANLGNFLIQVTKYYEGIAYLDEAISIDPEYPNPYASKGLALLQLGRIKEGKNCMQKAADLGDAKAKEVLPIIDSMFR